MAISKFSKPVQLESYDVLDEQILGKALEIKQNRFDQGLQKAQMALDTVHNLDIIKSSQKEYLDRKMEDLTKNINSLGGTDYSNSQEIYKLQSMISSVTDDAIVKNALVDTRTARSFLKQSEALRTNPNHAKLRSPILEQRDDEAFQKYLQNPDLNARWTQSTPSVNSGLDEEVVKIANAIKPIKNTTISPDGQYFINSEDRTVNQMIQAVVPQVTSDPAHMEMLRKEYEYLYRDPRVKQQLFEVDRQQNIREIEKVIDETKTQALTNKNAANQLKQYQELLKQVKTAPYNENSVFNSYVRQRVVTPLAGLAIHNQEIKNNQGYLSAMQLNQRAVEHRDKMKMEDKKYELDVFKALTDKNPNVNTEMLDKMIGSGMSYGQITTALTNPTFTDPLTSIPTEGTSYAQYNAKVTDIAKDSNIRLKDGILNLMQHADNEFANKLSNLKITDRLKDPGYAIGPNTIKIVKGLRDQMEKRRISGQPLTPVEQKFSSLIEDFDKSSYIINQMKNERDAFLKPVLAKHGITYDEYVKYGTKEDGGFFTSLFGAKTPERESYVKDKIEDIHGEVDINFKNSPLNTFTSNNTFYTLKKDLDLDLKNAALSYARTNGLVDNKGNKFFINESPDGKGNVLSNVDLEKITFNGKVSPGKDEIEVTVPSGKGDTKSFNTYTLKLPPTYMGEITKRTRGEFTNSQTASNTDTLMEELLKKNGKYLSNGKELSFRLSDITGLPLSNELKYRHVGDGVIVLLDGKVLPMNGVVSTKKEAELKIQKTINQLASEYKQENPNLNAEQLSQKISNYFKQNLR